MRLKAPLDKHKQLKLGLFLVPVCTRKYKLRLKAPPNKQKQLNPLLNRYVVVPVCTRKYNIRL